MSQGPKALFVLATAALETGCGYYGCKDDLKRDYVPDDAEARWQNPQTLELRFGGALRNPAEVDPGRFALLRYSVEFEGADSYYCEFEVCYRELPSVAAIPESLDWDPEEPAVLQLNFAEGIPASACERWKGQHANYQALGLIYLGVDPPTWSGSDTGGEDVPELDQLAWADDVGVEVIGAELARDWLESCRAGSCNFDDFCVGHHGYFEYTPIRDLWLDCPEG